MEKSETKQFIDKLQGDRMAQGRWVYASRLSL